MPRVDSDAIGRRVAEARTRAGLTQAELAQATELDRTALAKIETGARRITALELARIAEQTDEALDWFVTEPPASIVSYRAGAGSGTTSSIDQRVERAARDVELLQGLGQLASAAASNIDQLRDAGAAMRLAVETRTALGIEPLAPIIDLVDPLAGIGLLAFSEDLGADAPDAATTLLERGGVSVINSDRSVGRRRLALAHELGHYLLADPYTVDWRVGAGTDAQRTESLIDAFARALLLPTDALRERWTELEASGSVEHAAVRIGSEYRVDMATLASRLFDLGLADRDQLAVVRATRTTRAHIIEYDLVVPHDLEGTTLPRRYEKAVLALFRSERVSAERAVDLLHGTVDVTGLPSLPAVSETEIWKFTS